MHPECKSYFKPCKTSLVQDRIRTYGGMFGVLWMDGNEKVPYPQIKMATLSALTCAHDLHAYVIKMGGELLGGGMGRFYQQFPQHRHAMTGSLKRFLQEYGPVSRLLYRMEGNEGSLLTIFTEEESMTKEDEFALV